MTIHKEIRYFDDNGFSFTFEPIEDTIKVKKTKKGYEITYLSYDNDSEFLFDEIVKGNTEVFSLSSYHSNFYVESDILTKDEIQDLFNGKKIPQQKKYHIFNLFVYSHSNVSLNIKNILDYKGGWDTALSGVVLVSKSEFKSKRKAEKFARERINIINEIISGQVFMCIRETYLKDKTPLDYEYIENSIGYDNALKELKALAIKR